MNRKLLGVDYGSVRIGLAVSDPDRKFAFPLEIRQRRDETADATFFRAVVAREDIGGLVVGLPIHLDGRESPKSTETRRFAQWLSGVTSLPVVLYDERFTSVQAEHALWDAGLSHKRRKERRDKVAAQMMLQAYLDAGCPENTLPTALDGAWRADFMNILDRIVATKHEEIAAIRQRVSLAELEARAAAMPPTRDFRAALLRGPGLGVIAEVKKASPSAGLIQPNFDPVAIARAYEAAGAACISVLTDESYFGGHLRYLEAIRAVVDVPLLRKDFLLDRVQLLEARLAGADCVLLIAEICRGDLLWSLFQQARELGMQALVELYDADNLYRVLEVGATLIGVNNRDLRSFEVRLEHTLELAARMPPEVCLVSESGIRTAADIERLRKAGVQAVLVGETLMRSDDVAGTMRQMQGVQQR